MKINLLNARSLVEKRLLITIMKTFIFFLCTTVFSLSTTNSFSQEKVLIDQDQLVTVDQVFKIIKKQTNYRFIYPKKAFKNTPKVQLKKGEIGLGELLKKSLSNNSLSFELTENNNILIKKIPIISDVKKPQGIVINGTVNDANGQPLPGANILEKGTLNGTQSDFDGRFSLTVTNEKATLVFSYIGFATQEIAFNGQSNLTITMVEDAAGLDEVVVVGYGTVKKSDLTGAVSSVSEVDLQSRSVPSFQGAIQGRASGVNIRQRGGDLDGDFDIAIRGVSSVTGSNSPLIVVDGVPLFSGSLSTINPKDIASVDILKDASATAIYGARASNGVVIISTKRGKQGKASFTVSTEQGIEEISKRYDLLSTEQQRQLFVDAFTHSGRDITGYDNPSDAVWQIDTDWQDVGTRTAYRQSYNLSAVGGSEKNKYAISAGYLDREGTLLKTDLRQWSLRLNLDSQINDKIKITSSLTGSHQKSNFVPNDSFFGNGYRWLVYQHSYIEPFDEEGNLTAVNTTAAPFFGGNWNPLIDNTLPTRERNRTRILGSVKLDAEIWDGLTVSANIGGDVLLSNDYNFFPVYQIGRFSRNQGSVNQSESQQVNWVADLTLNYKKTFGIHAFDALAGVSVQQFINTGFSANGSGTLNNALNQLSNQSTFNAGGFDVSAGLSSAFFRLNYINNDKYLVTGTIRRDGSSKFGTRNRYGVFPSGSVAWKLSEEAFLEDSSIINNLKLRTSYGLTGNQNIGDFEFITRAGGADYVFGNSAVIGNAPVNIGNEDLKWESAKQFDVGVDVGLFGGRLNFELDYYNKKSEDLLISIPIPFTSGVSERPTVNLGSVKNSGVEFAINSKNLKGGDLTWTTDFNITFNTNKVLDIGTNAVGDPLELPGSTLPLSGNIANLTVAGRPVGAFYMYEFEGIWQLGEEAEAAAFSNSVPGDPKYADLNNNGIFDDGDRTFVGNPHPKFFGGINNTITYKDFSLSVFANFAGGYQLFNSARNFFARSVPFVQNFAEVADYWTPTNPSNEVPRASQGGNTTFLATRVSTRFLEDADFLRIKNVSLSYNLPQTITKKLNMQSVKLTLSGTNLFTFTKYKGLDPEASSVNNLLSVGIDHTPYPLTKVYNFSAAFTF